MVVICPKCKVRLKVVDEKIAREGTRFRCPKCSTVLLVKKSLSQARTLDEKKILVAHEDPSLVERIKSILAPKGYNVVVVGDGINAMVNATKERPFLALLSVSLPKIYGFEVSERLRKRPETKDMKIILVASLYDKSRYRREPSSLHGADGYIEEHEIEGSLIEKIDALRGVTGKGAGDATGTKEERVPRPQTEVETPPEGEKIPQPAPVEKKSGQQNEMVEKAKRLARTIVSDIYLYSRSKVEDSIRNNTFHIVFASELKEGLKLYEARIPAEIRKMGDFFNEAVNNFLDKKRN